MVARALEDARWAPVLERDLAGVADLMTSIEAHDWPAPRTLHSWREQLGQLGVDPARTRAVRLPDGRLVAAGWVFTRPQDDPPRRTFAYGGVHPDFRRQGLGRALLGWQLEVARDWQRSMPDAGPISVIVVLPAAQRDADGVLGGYGLAAARTFDELGRELPAGLTVIPPDGIAIEPLTPDRWEEVREVNNEAFADHWGARPAGSEVWTSQLLRPSSRPDWSWVARDTRTGQIVGFALNSEVPDPGHGLPRGWTDTLGVLAGYRRRRVGYALMAATLTSFDRAGLSGAGLGVDDGNAHGAQELYARLGYRAGLSVVVYVRSEPAAARG